MYLSDLPTDVEARLGRRQFPRFDIQCRARIRIGTRQYAGYLHNISRGGARLTTFSSIRKPGTVFLRIPDLPALRCELRWTDSCNAGVSFAKSLSREEFVRWARTRSSFDQFNQLVEFEIAETEFPE